MCWFKQAENTSVTDVLFFYRHVAAANLAELPARDDRLRPQWQPDSRSPADSLCISASSGSSESCTARPKRVAEQLAAELADEGVRACGQQVVPQAIEAVEFRAVHRGGHGVDRRDRPRSLSRCRPIASKPSSEKPNGSIRLMATEHSAASLLCFSISCRTVSRRWPRLHLGQLRHILRRPGQLLAEQHFADPVAAQDRAGARCARLLAQRRRLRQNSAAGKLFGVIDLPPLGPGDAGMP